MKPICIIHIAYSPSLCLPVTARIMTRAMIIFLIWFIPKAYETYSDNPIFADGKTLREPVEGTISQGMIPYPYEKNDTDRLLAGKELINPLAASNENLKRGEVLITAFALIAMEPWQMAMATFYIGVV